MELKANPGAGLTIGVVGGMGPYATVDLYKRLVDAFPTEKDWQKPRILIDSYSTIPSRVRAVLYHEKEEEVIKGISESVSNLIRFGANRIIIACNTAHVFLPEVIKRIPESQDIIINIIEAAAQNVAKRGYKQIHLLASEGTVQTGIYKTVFSSQDIEVVNPTGEQLIEIRKLIEDVKQNRVSDTSLREFQTIINQLACIALLGCTELPVLYRMCGGGYNK